MTHKLENIKKTYRCTTIQAINKRYIEFSDNDKGWSNGYMADFIGLERLTIRAKAQELEEKGKLDNFAIDDSKPKAKALIDKLSKGYIEVDKISTDFEIKDMICLSGGKINTWVNARYLSYFIQKYEHLGFNIMISDSLKPVKIMAGEELIGLIMPLRKQD